MPTIKEKTVNGRKVSIHKVKDVLSMQPRDTFEVRVDGEVLHTEATRRHAERKFELEEHHLKSGKKHRKFAGDDFFDLGGDFF